MKRGAFRLDPGETAWQDEGFTGVLLPAFPTPVDVVLVVPGDTADGARYLHITRWFPNQALHLYKTGLEIKRGSIRFVCLLYSVGNRDS